MKRLVCLFIIFCIFGLLSGCSFPSYDKTPKLNPDFCSVISAETREGEFVCKITRDTEKTEFVCIEPENLTDLVITYYDAYYIVKLNDNEVKYSYEQSAKPSFTLLTKLALDELFSSDFDFLFKSLGDYLYKGENSYGKFEIYLDSLGNVKTIDFKDNDINIIFQKT